MQGWGGASKWVWSVNKAPVRQLVALPSIGLVVALCGETPATPLLLGRAIVGVMHALGL